MFVRVKTIVQDGRSYEYLQIVRSVRDGTRVRQELVASLGHRDLLVATGQLDQLLQALARFSARLWVVEAAKDQRFVARAAKSWARPWCSAGCGNGRACRRCSAAWLRVAGSASIPSGWPSRWPCSGCALRARTCRAPRGRRRSRREASPTWRCTTSTAPCHGWRHALERELFFQGRDLFSGELDLVFVDTTSVYLYRDGESALIRHGYSRDRRPDLPQLVLCVAVDGQGWPVAFAVLPGNTADVEALSLATARFRERFRIRRAVVVADHGTLGQATLAQLRDHVTAPFDYILNCPLRCERTVAEEVLGRPGRYQQVADNLEVKSRRCGLASGATSSAATRSRPRRTRPIARRSSPSCSIPSRFSPALAIA